MRNGDWREILYGCRKLSEARAEHSRALASLSSATESGEAAKAAAAERLKRFNLLNSQFKKREAVLQRELEQAQVTPPPSLPNSGLGLNTLCTAHQGFQSRSQLFFPSTMSITPLSAAVHSRIQHSAFMMGHGHGAFTTEV